MTSDLEPVVRRRKRVRIVVFALSGVTSHGRWRAFTTLPSGERIQVANTSSKRPRAPP